jgi:competence protein ComEC
VAASACLGGLALAAERLRAIDAGAVHAAQPGLVEVRGFATAVPRRARGMVSVRVQTADGRLLVRAPEPVPEIPVGREIEARGILAEPAEWERGYLRTHGIHAVVEARRIALTAARRGGAAALMDGVRDRAEAALERGMPAAEAALARGFVLGQDDRIDARTVEEFKRSGLAHLLAVSGQNVVLLGLLAVPLLAALGVSLRARLICIMVLIAIYVPVTGAGPSIQRAGVMGAAAIVAGLAGTPRSRWYALGLAAFATLAVNPRASADVGWQLSFAAVAGILLWAAPIRAAILSRRGSAAERARTPIRRALADGASLTIAATLATAPLMAHHFESLSVAALPANMLALPAVAPVMWLGMLTAMAGQVPAIPVEPLNALNALLIGYVAWVAHVLGSPGWAQAGVQLSPAGTAAAYAALLAAGGLGTIASARREGMGLRMRPVAVAACVAALALIGVAAAGGSPSRLGPPPGLEVSVLDVGQGDAILFEPADEDAVLVDGGPPGAGIAEQLRAEGVERLGLVVLSHDSLDHAAGVREALASVPVGALAHANASPETIAAARAAGARVIRVAAGRVLRAGPLRLEVLWPPPELVERPHVPSAFEAEAAEAEELNARAVVLLASFGGFSMLLTADAEAETVPLRPGPIDVLKVAHHGSEDQGLGDLLDRSAPRLAVIPVGAGNPYGHPTPQTLSELAAQDVPVLRTDLHGPVQIEVDAGRWAVLPGVE